jgi:hypothetical protein
MKFVCSGRACFSCVFILLAVLSGQSPQLLALPRSSSPEVTSQVDLQIVVLEGEDGVNVIKNKTAVKPLVEVRDKNKGPGAGVIAGGIAGAVVLFVLPEKGASGTFPNGWRWAQVTTDSNGRAVAPEIHPTGKGYFKIEIRATYQGYTVTRLITQSNFSTVAQARKAGKTPGSSTHDNVEDESSQQAQDAGQSGTQAGSSASSAASAGASAGAAAGAGTATGGSHTGLIVGALAAGGAAAGAAAYVVSKQNNSKNCDSLLTQANNQLAQESNACLASGGDPSQQCQSAAQTSMSIVGQYCSCAGGNGALDPTQLAELQADAQLYNLTYPSACH